MTPPDEAILCSPGEANHDGRVIKLHSRPYESYGRLDGVAYSALIPGALDPRCPADAGSRPSWMSPDQYDPCRCVLGSGHEGPHQCRHQDTRDLTTEADR